MPLVRAVVDQLVTELYDQMSRCPGCHGVGKIRQSGDYQTHFCLVCDEPAKALYRVERDDAQGMADLSNPKVAEILEPSYNKLAAAAREFSKRCPGCYGIRKIWIGDQVRPCLVCQRLHEAIDAYEEAMANTDISLIIYGRKEGKRL